MHQFDNVTSIMFVVDLACYDQVLPEESNKNAMMEQLVIFDGVVNSRLCVNTSIILLLANVSIFKQKMERTPLQNYFPYYSGGNNFNRAAKYLLWHFNQVNRAKLNLYPHIVDPCGGPSTTQAVFSAIRETMLQKELRSNGFSN